MSGVKRLMYFCVFRMRHQQAKDVVLALRESIKEKDEIINDLKTKGPSETSVKEALSVVRANSVKTLLQVKVL